MSPHRPPSSARRSEGGCMRGSFRWATRLIVPQPQDLGGSRRSLVRKWVGVGSLQGCHNGFEHKVMPAAPASHASLVSQQASTHTASERALALSCLTWARRARRVRSTNHRSIIDSSPSMYSLLPLPPPSIPCICISGDPVKEPHDPQRRPTQRRIQQIRVGARQPRPQWLSASS